ncbi:MAG: invasion associated locus B family protein [Aquisalinus sp.]|nr:invasion associated locus B family protein [Aquisalinus sp.]
MMMKKTCLTSLLTLILAFGLNFAQPALAQQPTVIATYKDWIVYKLDLGGDTVCYAVTEPTDKSPRSVNHGDVFFMVSSWSSGVAEGQPSFLAGYDLREAPEPVVRIGSDKWEMYTSEKEGFVERDTDERRLVAAMKRGSDMRVSAISARGTATNYTFSLLGITDSLNRIEKDC